MLAEIARQVDAMGSPPESIELGIASDDHEARTIGWPCVGAQRASIALVVARGTPHGLRFHVVPRGSTVATAAAADAHES